MGDMRKGSNNSDLPVCIQSSKSNQVVFSDASKVDAEILDGAAVVHNYAASERCHDIRCIFRDYIYGLYPKEF